MIKSQRDLLDLLDSKRGGLSQPNSSRLEYSYRGSPDLTERKRETEITISQNHLESFRVADLRIQKITVEAVESPEKESPPFDNNIYKMQYLRKQPSLSQLKFEAEYHKNSHKIEPNKFVPVLIMSGPNRNKYV